MQKTIKKHFDTIKKAENYQAKLCNKYNYVRLVSFPTFSENGNYIFQVK